MARLRRRPSVERSLAGGRRLVQPRGASTATRLSGSAPTIWDMLADHDTLDSLVAACLERFPDPPEVVAPGATAAVEMLVEQGLLEVLES